MRKALLPVGATFLLACFFIGAYFRQGGFDLESAARAFGLALLGLLIIYGVWEVVTLIRHTFGWGRWR